MKKLILSAFLISLAAVSYGQNVETINYSNGDIYVGELRDGQRSGHGTYTYANGDVYVGEFRGGQRNGQGTYSHANGDVYFGEFKDDKRNGQGTLTFGPGDFKGVIYVGRWRDGEYIGQ